MEEPELLTRFSCDSNQSPEFEFWMVRNPLFPQPDFSSADELFSHGILLPLRPFNQNESPGSVRPDSKPDVSDKIEPESSGTVRSDSKPVHELDVSDKIEPESSGSGVAEIKPGPEISAGEFTASKRWKDIFKKNSQNSKDESIIENRKKKKTKKEKKCGGNNGVNTAELNINIWPFSRSRSAGNGGSTRPRVLTRKVNSAPCSRSNSAGDQSRKSPSSPGRSGVHLGRSSPVWQVRRSSEGHRKASSTVVTDGPRARVLKLNVPMCIGYRQNSVCRSDEYSSTGVVATGGGGAVTGEGVRSSNNLFSLLSIFSTKKVH